MPAPLQPDPFQTLNRLNLRTRHVLQHVQTLLTAAPAQAREAAHEKALPAISGTIIEWFDGPTRQQQDLLELVLVPVLLESVAGSDAICIRDLATRLATEARKLQQQWNVQLRPLIKQVHEDAGRENLQTGRASAKLPGIARRPVDGQAVQHWVQAYRQHLDRMDKELLPMAARLLDDAGYSQLATACLPLAPFKGSLSAGDQKTR